MQQKNSQMQIQLRFTNKYKHKEKQMQGGQKAAREQMQQKMQNLTQI